MFGERKMIASGYRWDVFAWFPCNASGVRVATRKTLRDAVRFANWFSKTNHVDTGYKAAARHAGGSAVKQQDNFSKRRTRAA
jgi:hypothetical protein